MNHYCTYFDSNYLPQGLALASSLQRHDPAGVLWVLALDDKAVVLLEKLARRNVRVVPLATLLRDDTALAESQRTRSRKEFIFTLTACWVRWLLQNQPAMDRVAYVDADMMFWSAVAPAWNELGDGSVLIVPHRYPAWHDDSALYGRFNVGWLIFRRDATALACLDWWREQCLASCALTTDGVHYGDQKYLDAWPERFGAAVIIGANPGVNLAPWNWARYRYDLDGTDVRVGGQPLVLFHYAQFRRIAGCWWDSGQLEYGIMPRAVRSRIYEPYAAALLAGEAEVRRIEPDFRLLQSGWAAALGRWHLALLRLFWGQYWRRCGSTWLAGRFGIGRWSGRFMGRYRRSQRRSA